VMAKRSFKGFTRNVYVNAPVYNQGESVRKQSEAMQAALLAETKKEVTENLVAELKPYIIDIVKRAFMRYAQMHGANEDLTKKEWQRFSGVLRRML
jgi:hypothetical protein